MLPKRGAPTPGITYAESLLLSFACGFCGLIPDDIARIGKHRRETTVGSRRF
jgi:hypothetical protein